MIQTDRPSCLNCGGLMEPAVPWRCKCEDITRSPEWEALVGALRAEEETIIVRSSEEDYALDCAIMDAARALVERARKRP